MGSIAEVVANGFSKDGTISIELYTKEELQSKLFHALSGKEALCGPVRVGC